MTKLNDGDVVVTLNGEELTLRPTLAVLKKITQTHGGLAKSYELLLAQNLNGICQLIAWGANLSDRDARELPERVYENGLTEELLSPLLRFVSHVGNGGHPLPDQPLDRPDGGSTEGNA